MIITGIGSDVGIKKTRHEMKLKAVVSREYKYDQRAIFCENVPICGGSETSQQSQKIEPARTPVRSQSQHGEGGG